MATASVPPLVSSIDKDVMVVISEKDTVQVNTHKKQTACRGKKYTGVKPANVGNWALTLNEQKKVQEVESEPKLPSNVIEDSHSDNGQLLQGLADTTGYSNFR